MAFRYGGDRFIPSRAGNRWQTKFGLMKDDDPNAITSVNFVENNEGRQAYSCLLRNEILGATIENMKGQCDERRAMMPLEGMRLFQYSRQTQNRYGSGHDASSLAPYSLSPVSAESQKLLRTQKAVPKISKVPYKVLDAPEILDDFYLNLLSWSSKNILAVGLGSCVYLWNACTGQVTELTDLMVNDSFVTSVAWNKRGNLLAIGKHHGYTQLWDVAANKQVSEMHGHSDRVGVLAWNADVLASGSRDGLILQRDVRTHQTQRKLVGHQLEVCGLKWSPDNQYLASGGDDSILYVWNMHSRSPVLTYDEHLGAVKGMAWSPHHRGLLVSGGGKSDAYLHFWNIFSGKEECIYTGSQVCNIAWSEHSSQLVSTHGYPENKILVWKYPSMTQIAQLTGHRDRVLYLAMSPDGERIVTGAGDETLRFWEVFTKPRSRKEINRS